METRPLEVQIGWTVIGRTTIEVPAELSLEDAIRYAEDHINKIKNPHETAVYLPDSDFIVEDGCRWRKPMPESTERKMNSIGHKFKSAILNDEAMRRRAEEQT